MDIHFKGDKHAFLKTNVYLKMKMRTDNTEYNIKYENTFIVKRKSVK